MVNRNSGMLTKMPFSEGRNTLDSALVANEVVEDFFEAKRGDWFPKVGVSSTLFSPKKVLRKGGEDGSEDA